MTSKDKISARLTGAIKEALSDTFSTNEIFRENEIQANYLTAKALAFFGVFMAITVILNEVGVFNVNAVVTRILAAVNIVLTLSACYICHRLKGQGKYLRLLLMGVMILCLSFNHLVLTYNVVLGMAIPVVLSIRYYNRKFTDTTAVFSGIIFAIAHWFGAYYGNLDSNHLSFEKGTIIEIIGTLDESLKNTGFDFNTYRLHVMTRDLLPRLMFLVVISVVSAEIAYRGYRMVVDQDRIAKERGRIDTELNLARAIQKEALPISSEYINHPTFDLAASMTPAREVGGDFYDFRMIDGTHLALTIADVSGKGVPSAMFMMISKLLLESGLETGRSPADVLTEVNAKLCERNMEDLFVTVWLGVVDLTTGEVIAANAGHEYPFIRKKGGEFEKFKDPHGLVLALMEGTRYKEYKFTLEPEDVLYIYTDGVTDARNTDGKFFGMENTRAALNRVSLADMEAMIMDMRRELQNYSGAADQYDDITMLAFRMNYLMKPDGILNYPTVEAVEKVQLYLNNEMTAHGVSKKERNRINIAVDEIYSNIANYGYATWVKVIIEITDQLIHVELHDNGIPFDPLEKETPDVVGLTMDDSVGGLGIFMTKQLMDKVQYRYEDGCNINELELNRIQE